MAKVSITSLFSNSLGDYSVYKQRGVDKLIIRFKGGPSAEKIKKWPQFASVRIQQSEIRGMGKFSQYLAQNSKGVKHLADYNYAGNFSKIGRLIQKMDTVSEAGKSAVMFSSFRSLIQGFNFNREHPFNSVVTPMPQFTISRSESKATVTFPDLYPGINIQSHWNFGLCRFIITLGLIPDLVHSDKGYKTACSDFTPAHSTRQGEWLSASSKIDAFSMEVFLSQGAKFNESVSLLLSVGIEFGMHISESVIQPVKHAGCAMILGVG